MAERPVTWQQRRILNFITEFNAVHGYSPTMREIGDATGLASTSSVSYQLEVLEARGLLRRGAGASRHSPRRITVTGRQSVVAVDRGDLAAVLGIGASDMDDAEQAALARLDAALAAGEGAA